MKCRALRLPAALLAVPGALPMALHAQDRLLGLRAAGASVSAEAVWFGGAGVPQASVVGGDTVRLTRATQLSVPITAVTPLGGNWSLDATTVYATGSVQLEGAPSSGARRRTATLAGLSDVRLRATGRLFDERLLITAGANLPTGRTALDAEQLTALRAIAAPALGMLAPPVGQGPSGTLGVLLARQAGAWALAGGVSYEVRGEFAPVSALVAGAPSIDFRPGNVVRGSLGADRLVGRHRVSAAFSADVFAEDRLRAGGAPASTADLAQVRLGPVFTSDVQLQLAAPRVRELVVWGTNRWRARFSRDGVTVPGSSGNYLDGGLRTSLPVAARTDYFLAGDARWHTGLDLDDALATAGVAGGGLTFGLSQRVGILTVQPFVRGQAGRLRFQRAADASFTGGTAGLTILTRF
jgi:hypothetical protein